MISITREKLAQMIDHTTLRPYDTRAKIKKLCSEAITYKFGAVCVNSVYTKLCAELLKGSDVKTCAVVGFPLGATAPDVKRYETELVVNQGAEEVDMVINIGALKDEDYRFVEHDIRGVVDAAGDAAIVKVILETGYLTDDEIVKACELAKSAGASFVKTSTGFGPMGALPSDIALMRKTVGSDMGVKAAGGITDFKSALRCIKAGADRLGTSSGIKILESLEWATYSQSWFIDEIPCTLCPSRAASLATLPESMYVYYKSKCRSCGHNRYNVFYDV
jgi:deoxyribose-phosphate aldolase